MTGIPHKDSAQRSGIGQPAHSAGFPRPLLVVVAIALALAALIFLLSRYTSDGTARPGAFSGGDPIQEIPQAGFTDITADSGIRFVHENGAYGEKLLPETMGGGVAFFDYDSDGDPDLLFVNSGHWPWRPLTEETKPALALYENNGQGQFTDLSAGSGLEATLYGMGLAVGDYDNDGRPDVFVSAVGSNRLFRNLGGGRFEDVTVPSGTGGSADAWSTSCAFVDYDNDGDLDLFVCNYVRWSREIDLEVDYHLAGIGRAYGPPMQFPGTFPYLYRNDGGGRFTDVSASSGVQLKNPVTGLPLAKSLGVAPVDIDGDHWIDLVVANDTVQNFVFRNQRDGTFKEVGAHLNVAWDNYGQVRGAMGIDTARFRDDDSLAIAIGNFANEMNALYVSQQDSLVFADEAVAAGIGPASEALLKFGLFFFDYDLDGRLDVLTANGHLEPEVERLNLPQRYRQPAQLFWNRGRGKTPSYFPVPPEKSGPALFQPIVGRGSAFADIDNDGDPDVVMTQIGGPPLLLRNDQQLGHSWFRLKLVGTRSNRDAIGAWIKVRVGNRTLSRQVMPARGYLSQSELPVTFGLGDQHRVDTITVIWPNGSIQTVDTVPLGQTTIVRQRD